jgi:hypothetical protein
MKREELRQAASHRRASGSEAAAERWECTYCNHSWVTELGFMKHKCKGREKLDKLQSVIGQAAYSYYSEWMRARKMSVPSAERFLDSRYYNAFIRFAEHVQKTAIPNVEQFIVQMIQLKYDPVMWTNRGVYAAYLEWFDRAYPPEKQFIESLEQLQQVAVENGVELKDVYTFLGVEHLIRLVRRRKVSPWFLVTSKRFISWASSLPEMEKQMVTDCVNVGAYGLKLQARPDLVQLFRAASAEVGL